MHPLVGKSVGVDMEKLVILAESFRHNQENMDILKTENGMDEAGMRPEGPGKSAKPTFRVRGEEMIEKEVKPSGNSGRVYLPLNWVGKYVKIIRID